jgi:hypothetical protein
VYLDAGDVVVLHPVNYYLRRLRPWTRAVRPSDPALYERLYVTGAQSPVLLPDWRQQQFMRRLRSSQADFVEEVARVSRIEPADIRARAAGPSPAQIDLDAAVLLLPGPYAGCADQAARLRIRP